jgi:LEA14-like dessication related protein
MKNFFTVVLIGVGVYLIACYNAIKSFGFNTPKFRRIKVSNGAINLYIYLPIVNGDGVSVPLTGLNIKPYVGDYQVGSVILESMTVMSGRAVSNVPITVIIPLSDLLPLAIKLVGMFQSKLFVFNLRGTASAVGITAPAINEKFEVNLKNYI